jgi:hypothetical protein
MTERRYTDDEAAAIFKRAAKNQQSVRRQLPPTDGMTLADLQEIGREVGIPAEMIAEAAGGVAVETRPDRRTFLGLPIGVGRSVQLPRRLTEDEWERLVVDLRETFAARGHVRVDGSLRQWTNGNLQVFLEPTATGQRLRLQTTKGDARSLMGTGLVLVGAAGATFLANLVSGGADWSVLSGVGFLMTGGLGIFGIGAGRVPSWAKTRASQMESIASRVLRITSAGEDRGDNAVGEAH